MNVWRIASVLVRFNHVARLSYHSLRFRFACPAIQYVRKSARRDWHVPRCHSMNDDCEQDRSRQYDAAKMLPDEFSQWRDSITKRPES
jgi:hypothetical protein